MLLLQQPYLVLELAEKVLFSWVTHRQQNLRSLLTYSSPETPDKWIYPSDFLYQEFSHQKKELVQDSLVTCKPKGVAYMQHVDSDDSGDKFPLSIKS